MKISRFLHLIQRISELLRGSERVNKKSIYKFPILKITNNVVLFFKLLSVANFCEVSAR